MGTTMNFYPIKLLLAVLIPCTFVLAEPLGEVRYELLQLGSGAAVLTVQAPAQKVSAVLSQDQRSMRVHLSEGVFVESGNSSYKPSGLVQKVDQIRGPLGVELVLALQRTVEVQALKGTKGMRFMIMAPELDSAADQTDSGSTELPKAEQSKEDCESSARQDREKIEELRGLVRDLTLELVNLKGAFQEKCGPQGAAR